MGLLNKKERVLDVVLTDKGRSELSRNQLDFSFYVFSDEGVDYSGSLSSSIVQSSSLDDYLHRNFAFESSQQKGKDLSTFLYTIPSRSKVLFEFTASASENTQIALVRRFVIDRLVLHTRRRNRIRKPIAVIMKATIPQETTETRSVEYVQSQLSKITLNRLITGRNVTGNQLSANHLLLNKNEALDVGAGTVIPVRQALVTSNLMKGFKEFADKIVAERDAKLLGEDDSPKEILDVSDDVSSPPPPSFIDAVAIKKEIEVVSGIDRKTIDFTLKTSDGQIAPQNGFLIEIFESGSDGKLTKFIQDSVEDPLGDDTIQEGFSSFLKLEIDKE